VGCNLGEPFTSEICGASVTHLSIHLLEGLLVTVNAGGMLGQGVALRLHGAVQGTQLQTHI